MPNPIVRPGIRPETLIKAGVSYDDYPYPDSIRIPYHSITGDPRFYTDHNGKQQQFARWRLPKQYETSQKKYHQPKGSPLFAYHPPFTIANADCLALFEGEFKFLSAHEEGLDGLGLPSFFVYTRQNDSRILLPEIATAIHTVHPQKILFFGDADTTANLLFSMSALFLAQAVKPLPVYLPRLCVAGPKGFDDLKESLKTQFAHELGRLITQAYLVNPENSYLALARDLLAIAQPDFKLFAPSLLSQQKDRLVKLCAQARLGAKLNGADLRELEEIARQIVGCGKRDFNSNVEAYRLHLLSEQKSQTTHQTPPDNRPRVVGPGFGKIETRVVNEIADIIVPQKTWFNRNNEIVVVEQIPTGFEYSSDPDKKFEVKAHSFGLRALTGLEAKHRLEEFMVPGHIVENDDGLPEFSEHSFQSEFCKGLVLSPGLLKRLPLITRILTVPIPFLIKGQLIYPLEGYDPRFGTYLVPGAPKIQPMSLEEAKAVLAQLHEGFCFVDDSGQSKTHSAARLLTPFSRGIIGFATRTPLWTFRANRPRAGKDYLALLALLIYEGLAFEEQPMEKNPEETQKRLLTMARAGRRFVHFSNQQTYMDHACFIQALTSETITGRNLGSNRAQDALILPNEMEFSISMNIGTTWREDLPDRMRGIDLAFYEEDANSRSFPDPFLHETVLQGRQFVLSAFAAFFQEWIKKGRPKGNPFTSFPRWGEIVGGVMLANNLGDPCKPQEAFGVNDRKTQAMRCLFVYASDIHKGNPISKNDIYNLIDPPPDKDGNYIFHPYRDEFFWFGPLCEGDHDQLHKNRTRLGQTLEAFNGRELCGIKFEIDKSSPRRPTYSFKKF